MVSLAPPGVTFRPLCIIIAMCAVHSVTRFGPPTRTTPLRTTDAWRAMVGFEIRRRRPSETHTRFHKNMSWP